MWDSSLETRAHGQLKTLLDLESQLNVLADIAHTACIEGPDSIEPLSTNGCQTYGGSGQDLSSRSWDLSILTGCKAVFQEAEVAKDLIAEQELSAWG